MAKFENTEIPVQAKATNILPKQLGKRKVYFSRLKRKLLKHVWVIRALILLGIITLSFIVLLFAGRLIGNTEIPYYANLAKNFVFVPKDVIKEEAGRTNVLILGKGGKGHEAPDLTDTMLLMSLDHGNNKITMISLPRDIWLFDLRTKLNSVYYWGNKKKSLVKRDSEPEVGGGLVLAKATVEEIVGQHVHYAVVLDFSAFKEIIDVLGGIDVDVENSFTDNKFPIPGLENDPCDGDPEYKCRYETTTFNTGVQHMNGETALKFARSRYAEGDEGTDFARQKRQQKIIKAIENKIMDKNILLSPKTLLQLKDVFLSNLETDIDDSEGAVLTRYLLNAKDNISSHVLPEDLLVNPPIQPQYDNLYVFIPKDDNWSGVQTWVECVLEGRDCP